MFAITSTTVQRGKGMSLGKWSSRRGTHEKTKTCAEHVQPIRMARDREVLLEREEKADEGS